MSSGKNSDLRYNFFYPRWAYDQYRALLGEQAQAAGWHYLDLWNLVPETEFTNSAIHLTPAGEVHPGPGRRGAAVQVRNGDLSPRPPSLRREGGENRLAACRRKWHCHPGQGVSERLRSENTL